MNMNVNSTDCLVKVEHFGYTAVNNICSGAVTNVAWGPFEWIGLVAIGIFVMFLFLFTFVAVRW